MFGDPIGGRTLGDSDSETPISRTGTAESAALRADFGPELATVIEAWPVIGEREKATILGIARAAVRKVAEKGKE